MWLSLVWSLLYTVGRYSTNASILALSPLFLQTPEFLTLSLTLVLGEVGVYLITRHAVIRPFHGRLSSLFSAAATTACLSGVLPPLGVLPGLYGGILPWVSPLAWGVEGIQGVAVALFVSRLLHARIPAAPTQAKSAILAVAGVGYGLGLALFAALLTRPDQDGLVLVSAALTLSLVASLATLRVQAGIVSDAGLLTLFLAYLSWAALAEANAAGEHAWRWGGNARNVGSSPPPSPLSALASLLSSVSDAVSWSATALSAAVARALGTQPAHAPLRSEHMVSGLGLDARTLSVVVSSLAIASVPLDLDPVSERPDLRALWSNVWCWSAVSTLIRILFLMMWTHAVVSSQADAFPLFHASTWRWLEASFALLYFTYRLLR